MGNDVVRKKEYDAVNVFKFFCALLVIAIHAKPFVNHFWLDAEIGLLTRFAVPYFFLSSSYFLFQKISRCTSVKEKSNYYGAYFLRLLRFYLIWYIIFNVFDIAFGGSIHSVQWYIKQFIFPTNGSSLWFVSALLWASLIVYMLTLFVRKETVLVISIVFLGLGYMLSTLLGVTEDIGIVAFLNEKVTPVIGVQNGLFFAFPYVALGSVMAHQDIKKQHKKNAGLALLFFILLGIESIVAVVCFRAPFTFIWLSALPMTYYIMRLTLTVELKSHPSFNYLRKMSTVIYAIHGLIIKLLIRMRVDQVDNNNVVLFLTAVAVSIGLSYGIVRLAKTKHFQFLKYMM